MFIIKNTNDDWSEKVKVGKHISFIITVLFALWIYQVVCWIACYCNTSGDWRENIKVMDHRDKRLLYSMKVACRLSLLFLLRVLNDTQNDKVR